MEDFKGNPDTPEKVNPRPSIGKPVTTNVVIKKESEAKKLGRKFFSEDAKTVGSHVAESVIIPSLQKLLSDAVKGAIDWLIYGSKGAKSQSGVGTISYACHKTNIIFS